MMATTKSSAATSVPFPPTKKLRLLGFQALWGFHSERSRKESHFWSSSLASIWVPAGDATQSLLSRPIHSLLLAVYWPAPLKTPGMITRNSYAFPDTGPLPLALWLTPWFSASDPGRNCPSIGISCCTWTDPVFLSWLGHL